MDKDSDVPEIPERIHIGAEMARVVQSPGRQTDLHEYALVSALVEKVEKAKIEMAGQLWPVEDVLSEVLNLIKGDGCD